MLSITNITEVVSSFPYNTIKIVLTILLKKGKEYLPLCGQLV